MSRFLLFIFLLFAFPGIADEAPPFPASKDDSSFTLQMLNMLATLGLLIALVFLVSWFVKRMMRTRMQQVNLTSSIKILEQRPLTHKTILTLVDIGGKVIAFAESTNGVTVLCEVPKIIKENVHV